VKYNYKYFRSLKKDDPQPLEQDSSQQQILRLKVPFPAGESAYNANIAWWLAQCSNLVYENKITVALELKDVGFDRICFFDTRGTQAFLATHPGVDGGGKFAVLAFRGTEQDSVDILTDINFVRRLFPDENLLENVDVKNKPIANQPKLYAHGGFLAGLENIWGTGLRKEIEDLYGEPSNVEWLGFPGVSNALLKLYQEQKDIALYVTGHSLGGALATLAAYQTLVYEQSFQVTALYTFGSPRTVQQPLAKAMNNKFEGRSHRVVNYIDVVPRLPPRIPIFLDFRHINQLVYFSGKRGRKTEQFPGEDTLVLLLLILELAVAQTTRLACKVLNLVGIPVKPYTPVTIQKHMISEYIRDLERDIF
jgi:hypothetical protein